MGLLYSTDSPTKMKPWFLFLLYVVSMTKAYVLIDPLTGRPIEQLSPTIQENKSEQQFFAEQSQLFDEQGLDFTEDLPLYKPQERRIPAPEYYAKDGKTPIYKIFRKHPYGRR